MALILGNAARSAGLTRWCLVAASVCLLLTAACSRETPVKTTSLSELQPVRLLELPAASFEVDVAAFTGSEWALWRNAALVDTVTIPRGCKGVALEARGSSCSSTWPLAELFVQGVRRGRISVSSTRWAWYLFPVKLNPGVAEVKIAFVNDRFSETEDINLFVRNMMLVGDAVEE
jgi:hypothetical protein